MKTVLVVDDEQALIVALEISLGRDYRVLSAMTGEDALISIKDCKPDLLLMDIMMPGLGGLETLKILKSHPKFKKIPVIIMSGARPLVRQAEYGWSGFLYKPFTVDELRAAIANLI